MTTHDAQVWATMWTEAFENSAAYSDDVLRAGSRLARNRPFADIEVAPGLLSASIEHRSATYTVQLGVNVLSDDQWDEYCAGLLGKPTNAVALLLGELPVASVDEDDDCVNVSLVPASSELYLDCNCGDWNGVCGHAAALMYEAANLIEADPFLLTTIRGRGRYELKSAVEAARAEQNGNSATSTLSGHPRGEDPGVPAAGAYRREPRELPSARRLPLRVGEPPSITVPPPVDSGVTADDICRLVAAASERARTLLYLEEYENVEGNIDLEVDVDLES